jgi:NADPH-dependent curcumin reductase CurA
MKWWNEMQNRQVTLAKRPIGIPTVNDFGLIETEIPELEAGQFLLRNLYISLDAGFRNWMSEGSGDNILPAMPLDAPVMGLTLGRVVASRHDDFAEGQFLMARVAWEEYSISDGSDFLVPLESDLGHPKSYHLGILGDTGMSAYFGLTDIGRPQPGETVLISAAGGAVGSVAGQIANLAGARTIGLAGSDEKCERLKKELGYQHALNHRSPDLADQLAALCPDGIDVYFDSVGGPLLEIVLDHIAEGARIPFCGAITDYNAEEPIPGPSNLFQLVTKSALIKGYMTHELVDRYPEARGQLSQWIDSGEMRSVEYIHDGIENTGLAFSELFQGKNFGKSIVRLAAAVEDGE